MKWRRLAIFSVELEDEELTATCEVDEDVDQYRVSVCSYNAVLASSTYGDRKRAFTMMAEALHAAAIERERAIENAKR